MYEIGYRPEVFFASVTGITHDRAPCITFLFHAQFPGFGAASL